MRTVDKSLHLFIFFDNGKCFVIEVEQDTNVWGAMIAIFNTIFTDLVE